MLPARYALKVGAVDGSGKRCGFASAEKSPGEHAVAFIEVVIQTHDAVVALIVVVIVAEEVRPRGRGAANGRWPKAIQQIQHHGISGHAILGQHRQGCGHPGVRRDGCLQLIAANKLLTLVGQKEEGLVADDGPPPTRNRSSGYGSLA